MCEIKCVVLSKETATKENFFIYLNNDNIKYVCCAGHGNEQRLCGYTESGRKPYTRILESREINGEISNGKIFHFFSCNTGVEKGLGERLSDYGASFIGYNKKVVGELNVLLGSQMEPDCSIAEYILLGYTVEEAFNWGKQQYRKVCNQISSPLVVEKVHSNMEALVIHGDKEATIYE